MNDNDRKLAHFADSEIMLTQEFAKKAMKHWFKHATGADLEKPEIYESVRVNLARSFRSCWKIRQITGELDY